MAPTTSATQSLWLDSAPESDYPRLEQTVDVDVAVVGGGIAGLMAAFLLCRDGARVAVLEAARVGSGVTGCTTAKVSALQSTVYSTIHARHGDAAAAVYAEASVAGVERIAEIATAEPIACDLERRDAFTYAAEPGEREQIEREAEIAARAGLPVDVVDGPDLPFATHGAVRLADQVQLHPVRFVQGLAAAVARAGSHVFEDSRALSLREARRSERSTVRTAHGTVRARHVVVASHFPVFDRGLYFARLEPQRSYCVGVRLASGAPPRGMSISAGSPTRSVRAAGDVLIVGGEGHPTASGDDTPERFARLEQFARAHWDVAAVTHRWSAQDPSHYDHLPVIGPYRPGSDRLWVAAGFMKWGLATAAFAAEILADAVAGRENPWAQTFSPTRLSPRSLHEVAHLGGTFAADMVLDRVRRPETHAPEQVPAGEARVVADGAGRKGVYRDEDGGLHAVSLRCTHLGCLLRFNAAERSWDCPCHGSRFDVDGEVLEGPAVHPLQRRDA